MSRRVRLRPWQHEALGRFASTSRRDFLAVATPGAGKTTFALAVLRTLLGERPARVVVVAPTAHLKLQWSSAAAGLGLHLDPAWSPGDGPPPADMHGVVTTYQQVAMSAASIAPYARDAYVVLDEVHHAGDEQAWGSALRAAFDGSARRLSLSGTPFRSDTRAIPYVRYEGDEAAPDYEYGYGDALREGRVVRPVYFPRIGGAMEWSAPDGNVHAATFDDPLATELANQRLRTALSLDGELLPTLVGEAVGRLRDVRRVHQDAAGLAIAIDREHARGLAELLSRRGVDPIVALSDDPDASRRIASFARGSGEWLVAVRMVSEGVDIPRLRVGVFATTTTTDLFFRQAVGRFVRWVPGIRDQRAWLYLPDDPRLRLRAATIAEQRRHSLRRDREGDGDAPPTRAVDDGEQLSLFAALSATPTGEVGGAAPWHEPLPDDWLDGGAGAEGAIEVDLAPPPPTGVLVGAGAEAGGGGAAGATGPGLGGRSLAQVRSHLRTVNADLARDLVRVTGLTYAQVNLELNRKAGIGRIDDATVDQLSERLVAAQRWRERLAR